MEKEKVIFNEKKEFSDQDVKMKIEPDTNFDVGNNISILLQEKDS